MTVLTSDVGVTDIAAHEERRARILAALAEKPDGVLEAIARDDQADKITPEMLEEYVSRAVVARTNDRQHPKRFQAIETIRSRFIDDGRIEIDSNIVERAIRPIALNRKNALFAGSDGGAENWAIVASLVETFKLNGVDPQAYMADVLKKIIDGHLASKLDDLMPWAYAPHTDLKDVA